MAHPLAVFSRLAALTLAAALAAPVAAAPATPDEVFDRYLAAVHAGDMTAVHALISPQVARSDFIGCQAGMDNPTCLAHYIETTIVKPRATVKTLHRSVQGTVVEADLEVRSALYLQAGVERIRGRDVVKVQDGLIVDFHFVPDFGDMATAVFFGKLAIGVFLDKIGVGQLLDRIGIQLLTHKIGITPPATAR